MCIKYNCLMTIFGVSIHIKKHVLRTLQLMHTAKKYKIYHRKLGFVTELVSQRSVCRSATGNNYHEQQLSLKTHTVVV